MGGPFIIYTGEDGGPVVYCGPVGNTGGKLCFDPNCEVGAHKKKARIQAAPEPGAYVLTDSPGVALSAPHVLYADVLMLQDVFEELKAAGRKLSKEHLIAIFQAMNTHCAAGTDITSIKEDLYAMMEALLGQNGVTATTGGVMSPMKPTVPGLKTTGLDDSDLSSDEEEQLDSDVYRKQVLKDQENLKAGLRMIQGALGTPSGEVGQVFNWMDGTAATMESMLKSLKEHKQKHAESKANVEGLQRVSENHEQRLGTTEINVRSVCADVGTMQQNLGQVVTVVEELLIGPPVQPGAAAPAPAGSAPAPAPTGPGFDTTVGDDNQVTPAQFEDVLHQIDELQAAQCEIKLDGGALRFSGAREVQSLLQGTPENAPYVWHDILSLLARIMGSSVGVDEVQLTDIHQAKTNRPHAYSVFISAAKSMLPAIFLGSAKTEAAMSTRPTLNAISSYNKFNKRDGIGGLGTYIRKRLPLTRKSLESEIEAVLRGHPEAITLAKTLVSKSCYFIVCFLDFLDNQRTELLTNCYGEGPYSKEAEQEVWELCLLLALVMFETLWVTRADAEHGYESPAEANFIYLMAALKTHMEMEAFIARGFKEHPNIMPKLFQHIFQSFVSRSAHRRLEEECQRMKEKVDSNKRSLDSLSTRVAALERRGGGDGGPGGPGAPGLSASQKKKQKQEQAKARAAKEAEDKEE